MKKIILTLAIVAALTGCKSNRVALDDNTYTATNEYLDTWCGSEEEEEAFIKLGVEPN